MDLLQSFRKTGHVIFCNVFLHTVCKTQDLLQLSQPLCLTQLLAAILSPCKHLQNELHSSFLHILTTLCSLACTLTTTHHFLGLKAPDMIQRFPFLVHLVHTVWLFLHDTPDFWGGQISDKTRIIWVASKVFYKRKHVSLAQNCVQWIHFPISHAGCVLSLLKNEWTTIWSILSCRLLCKIVNVHNVASWLGATWSDLIDHFPFPTVHADRPFFAWSSGCSCRSSGCSCRSSGGFGISILIFRRCMMLVIWLVVASFNLDRFAILFSHHNFPLDHHSSTDNLQSCLST